MIRELAEHDYLTGLPNRRAFSDSMTAVVADAAQASATYSILLIDLDGFKPINDIHGHEIGDLVLRETARRLKENMRETDRIARLGGDEFAFIHFRRPKPPVTAVSSVLISGAWYGLGRGLRLPRRPALRDGTLRSAARLGDRLLRLTA
jgi:diguanylate cyclase (GGDEF)-like protein